MTVHYTATQQLMRFQADSVEHWLKAEVETLFLGNAEQELALTICNIPGTQDHYFEWNDQSNACTNAVKLWHLSGQDLHLTLNADAATQLGEASFTITLQCDEATFSEASQCLSAILGDRFEVKTSVDPAKLMAAPKPTKDYSQIKYLNLEGKNLKVLPDYVQEMVSLETAKLGHNPKLNIDAACEILGKLPLLKELSLTTDEPIPASIGNLRQLESLSLDGMTKPQVFPESFGQLTKLKDLLVMSDSDVVLPESFAELSQLEQLNMRVQSWQLPTQFYRLSGLTELDLSNCRLEQAPDEMAEMVGIETVMLASSEPQDYAQVLTIISRMPNVRRLELAINPIPKEVGLCQQIDELVIYGGSQEPLRLADEVFNLSRLKKLLINYSLFDEVPSAIGRLQGLEHLLLMECEFEILPESVGDLSNLTFLNVSENPLLQTLPSSLSRLVNLEMLYLRDNPLLTRLPESLGVLKNLKQLSLSNPEKIENVPSEWSNLFI